MDITHSTRGSKSIISVRGRWVCGYDVRNDLRVTCTPSSRRLDVVLDLMTFANSTVVGEIASTHIALHRRGGRLTLLNPSKRMSLLLSISRLTSVIEIRPTAWGCPVRC